MCRDEKDALIDGFKLFHFFNFNLFTFSIKSGYIMKFFGQKSKGKEFG
jgi:hypothetical protein